jgi:hypothetical protein
MKIWTPSSSTESWSPSGGISKTDQRRLLQAVAVNI